MRIYDNGIYRDMTPDEVSEYESALKDTADTEPDRLFALESENKKLASKLEAAIEANANLEECIVEMAEIVYG